MTDKLTRVVQAELAFPLNYSWEEIGSRLAILRSQSHRLLNAGIVGLFANRHFDPEDQAGALTYIQAEIQEIEAWAIDNGVEHLQQLDLPGTMTDRMQRICIQKVQHWYRGKGKTRIPSFKEGAPIMLRDGAWSLELDEQHRFTLELPLWSMRTDDKGKRRRVPQVRFALKSFQGRGEGRRKRSSYQHFSQLKQIAQDPTVKRGDLKILKVKKKWLVQLTYTTDLPKKTKLTPKVVMAVNRGRHNMLFAACTTAGKQQVIWPGEDVLAKKQQFRKRRADRKRSKRVQGSGCAGHGTARRYARYAEVETTEANYVRTTCQQAAAKTVEVAKKWGAGTILVEDFSKLGDEDLRYVPSWPYYQLKTAILWAAKKAGIRCQEVPASYISSTCPLCGSIDKSQHNLSTGTFHCAQCDFERAADTVACLNMLDEHVGIKAWRKGIKSAMKVEAAVASGDLDQLKRDLQTKA